MRFREKGQFTSPWWKNLENRAVGRSGGGATSNHTGCADRPLLTPCIFLAVKFPGKALPPNCMEMTKCWEPKVLAKGGMNAFTQKSHWLCLPRSPTLRPVTMLHSHNLRWTVGAAPRRGDAPLLGPRQQGQHRASPAGPSQGPGMHQLSSGRWTAAVTSHA